MTPRMPHLTYKVVSEYRREHGANAEVHYRMCSAPLDDFAKVVQDAAGASRYLRSRITLHTVPEVVTPLVWIPPLREQLARLDPRAFAFETHLIEAIVDAFQTTPVIDLLDLSGIPDERADMDRIRSLTLRALSPFPSLLDPKSGF